jgi:hypothetical protein
MNKIAYLFLMACLLLSCISCGGPKRPDGMPPLHPTRIVITQAGELLEGATVTLVNIDDPSYRWIVGGVTDARGVCQVRTQGEFAGAPEGRYKVLVQRTITTESETRRQPMPEDAQAARAYYEQIAAEERSFDTVNLKYKQFDTTDLEIEITRGSNVKEFDVGEAVRQEFIPFGASR